jgi:hypothetical protein
LKQDQSDTLLMSDSLKGVIDENQFYQESISDTRKNFARLDFLNSEKHIEVDLNFMEIDRASQEIKIQFECNKHLTGEILDKDLTKLSADFSGYVFIKEITSTKKEHVDFSTSDLCIVTLTFCFASPI